MFLERITHTEHPMYHEGLKLYRISFPHHEQREPASQENILNDGEYHFSLIYDKDIFVGLVLYWECESFLYIEHFCILPEVRNKQYGKKTLDMIKHPKKILLLEIDPPVDSISKRRKGFYERCGFIENPFKHIHPPYHKGDTGHKLVVMTCPEEISQDMFQTFVQYLNNKVMKDAFI